MCARRVGVPALWPGTGISIALSAAWADAFQVSLSAPGESSSGGPGLGGKAAESQRRVAKWLRTTVARERGLEQRAAGELRLAHVAGSCASRATLPVDRLVSAARLFDVRDVVRPTTTQPGSVAPLGSSSAPGPAHLAPHRWARKGTGTPRVSISNSGLRVRTHGQSNSSLILSLLVALGVLLLLAALGSKLRSPDSRQARAGSPSAGAAFGPALRDRPPTRHPRQPRPQFAQRPETRTTTREHARSADPTGRRPAAHRPVGGQAETDAAAKLDRLLAQGDLSGAIDAYRRADERGDPWAR